MKSDYDRLVIPHDSSFVCPRNRGCDKYTKIIILREYGLRPELQRIPILTIIKQSYDHDGQCPKRDSMTMLYVGN